MTRKALILVFMLLAAMALPVSASQFLEISFDDLARDSALIVRGKIGPVHSAWDDAHEVIYSYATFEVSHYFGGHGPSSLMLREVGGVVGNRGQAAIGFPTLREGQEVVLFLTAWENGDWRINAFAKGKYLVEQRAEGTILRVDPVTQGHERAERGGRDAHELATEIGMTIEEFAQMVGAARNERPQLPARQK